MAFSQETPLKDEQTNAVAQVTIAAKAGLHAVIDWILAGYGDRNLSFALDIENPTGTLRARYPIHGADGFGLIMVFPVNTAVTVKLPAGGTGKVGYLNVGYHYST